MCDEVNELKRNCANLSHAHKYTYYILMRGACLIMERMSIYCRQTRCNDSQKSCSTACPACLSSGDDGDAEEARARCSMPCI